MGQKASEPSAKKFQTCKTLPPKNTPLYVFDLRRGHGQTLRQPTGTNRSECNRGLIESIRAHVGSYVFLAHCLPHGHDVFQFAFARQKQQREYSYIFLCDIHDFKVRTVLREGARTLQISRERRVPIRGPSCSTGVMWPPAQVQPNKQRMWANNNASEMSYECGNSLHLSHTCCSTHLGEP